MFGWLNFGIRKLVEIVFPAIKTGALTYSHYRGNESFLLDKARPIIRTALISLLVDTAPTTHAIDQYLDSLFRNDECRRALYSFLYKYERKLNAMNVHIFHEMMESEEGVILLHDVILGSEGLAFIANILSLSVKVNEIAEVICTGATGLSQDTVLGYLPSIVRHPAMKTIMLKLMHSETVRDLIFNPIGLAEFIHKPACQKMVRDVMSYQSMKELVSHAILAPQGRTILAAYMRATDLSMMSLPEFQRMMKSNEAKALLQKVILSSEGVNFITYLTGLPQEATAYLTDILKHPAIKDILLKLMDSDTVNALISEGAGLDKFIKAPQCQDIVSDVMALESVQQLVSDVILTPRGKAIINAQVQGVIPGFSIDRHIDSLLQLINLGADFHSRPNKISDDLKTVHNAMRSGLSGFLSDNFYNDLLVQESTLNEPVRYENFSEAASEVVITKKAVNIVFDLRAIFKAIEDLAFQAEDKFHNLAKPDVFSKIVTVWGTTNVLIKDVLDFCSELEDAVVNRLGFVLESSIYSKKDIFPKINIVQSLGILIKFFSGTNQENELLPMFISRFPLYLEWLGLEVKKLTENLKKDSESSQYTRQIQEELQILARDLNQISKQGAPFKLNILSLLANGSQVMRLAHQILESGQHDWVLGKGYAKEILHEALTFLDRCEFNFLLKAGVLSAILDKYYRVFVKYINVNQYQDLLTECFADLEEKRMTAYAIEYVTNEHWLERYAQHEEELAYLTSLEVPDEVRDVERIKASVKALSSYMQKVDELWEQASHAELMEAAPRLNIILDIEKLEKTRTLLKQETQSRLLKKAACKYAQVQDFDDALHQPAVIAAAQMRFTHQTNVASLRRGENQRQGTFIKSSLISERLDRISALVNKRYPYISGVVNTLAALKKFWSSIRGYKRMHFRDDSNIFHSAHIRRNLAFIDASNQVLLSFRADNYQKMWHHLSNYFKQQWPTELISQRRLSGEHDYLFWYLIVPKLLAHFRGHKLILANLKTLEHKLQADAQKLTSIMDVREFPVQLILRYFDIQYVALELTKNMSTLTLALYQLVLSSDFKKKQLEYLDEMVSAFGLQPRLVSDLEEMIDDFRCQVLTSAGAPANDIRKVFESSIDNERTLARWKVKREGISAEIAKCARLLTDLKAYGRLSTPQQEEVKRQLTALLPDKPGLFGATAEDAIRFLQEGLQYDYHVLKQQIKQVDTRTALDPTAVNQKVFDALLAQFQSSRQSQFVDFYMPYQNQTAINTFFDSKRKTLSIVRFGQQQFNAITQEFDQKNHCLYQKYAYLQTLLDAVRKIEENLSHVKNEDWFDNVDTLANKTIKLKKLKALIQPNQPENVANIADIQAFIMNKDFTEAMSAWRPVTFDTGVLGWLWARIYELARWFVSFFSEPVGHQGLGILQSDSLSSVGLFARETSPVIELPILTAS